MKNNKMKAQETSRQMDKQKECWFITKHKFYRTLTTRPSWSTPAERGHNQRSPAPGAPACCFLCSSCSHCSARRLEWWAAGDPHCRCQRGAGMVRQSGPQRTAHTARYFFQHHLESMANYRFNITTEATANQNATNDILLQMPQGWLSFLSHKL